MTDVGPLSPVDDLMPFDCFEAFVGSWECRFLGRSDSSNCSAVVGGIGRPTLIDLKGVRKFGKPVLCG